MGEKGEGVDFGFRITLKRWLRQQSVVMGTQSQYEGTEYVEDFRRE